MQFRQAAVSAVGLALAAVLATGCGRAAEADSDEGSGPADNTATHAKTTELAERLGADRTTIIVGSVDDTVAVQVYEDMRCPVCKEFEGAKSGAPALRELTQAGIFRTEYTLASFLDDGLGGAGSKRAANALRAALEKKKFTQYHDVLFAHQPEESVDGYTDEFLLRMASLVPGLRGADFDSAVRTMEYRGFVTASEKAYEKAKTSGTPGFGVNGRLVPDTVRGAMFDPKLLATAVEYTAMPPSSRPKLS
ncbi:DsbA family protein [Streptomyces sp. NPDC088348]|uniref:DsbA family protein n=1 Tax=Streptomyces sp. NPDC088348 TaxID=3365853 RepID=UPI003824F77B